MREAMEANHPFTKRLARVEFQNPSGQQVSIERLARNELYKTLGRSKGLRYPTDLFDLLISPVAAR